MSHTPTTTITCRVLLFAQLAERVNERSVSITMSSPATVGDALIALESQYEPIAEMHGRLAVAIGDSYVTPAQALSDGDELALIPPSAAGKAMLTPTDDRGKKCAVAGLTPKQLRIRALGVRRLADTHSQEEMSLTSQSEIAWAIGGGVAGAALWQIVHRQWPVFGIIGLIIGFIVVSVCAAMIAWWLTLGRVRRGKFRHLSDVYLSTGQCASCAYRLTGLDAEDDDCVVCPECGAAWLNSRIAVDKDDE